MKQYEARGHSLRRSARLCRSSSAIVLAQSSIACQAAARTHRRLAVNEKRGDSRLRMALVVLADQTASSSSTSVSTSLAMSCEAESCRASATISAELVPLPTAERALWRLVHRRASALFALSPKITSPAAGLSDSPENES